MRINADKTPEIDLKLTTKIVKGGLNKKMTVENMFYIGFFGKLKTVYYWLVYNRDKSFKEYLNSPVIYHVELCDLHCYHSIDAEEELAKLLLEEIDN